MSKQDDPLASLWQSQPVQTIEPAELKAMWQKNKKRQWCWLASELGGGLFAIVFCLYTIFTDDNLFLKTWGVFFVIFASVVTPMTVKLRYKSLKSNVATSKYFQLLIEQKHNNIKLVKLTAWTMIVVTFFYPLWSNAYFIYSEQSPVIYFHKSLKAGGIILFTVFLSAIWGKYEIKKNERELEKFSKMEQ